MSDAGDRTTIYWQPAARKFVSNFQKANEKFTWSQCVNKLIENQVKEITRLEAEIKFKAEVHQQMQKEMHALQDQIDRLTFSDSQFEVHQYTGTPAPEPAPPDPPRGKAPSTKASPTTTSTKTRPSGSGTGILKWL